MAVEAGRAELERLRAELAELRAEIMGGTGAKVKEARAGVARMASDAYEYQRDALDSVAEQVRDRPFSSMLAAFGLGLLIAGLLVRR